MKVPFGTLTITDTAKKYMNQAIQNEQLSQGKFVKQLEEKFAEFIGTKYAVAVNSGTAAITIALSTLYEIIGAQRYDNIIIPALTFIASSNAILQAGFIPKFVDIDINTLNLDLSKINKVIDKNTAGILPVHLMGKPVDISNLFEIDRNIPDIKIAVIEDAAEAHGAEIDGFKVGTLGLAGCFSLYVAHIVSSIEGGIITTDSPEVARLAKSLRNHGKLCDCNKCVIQTDPDACPRRTFNNPKIDPRFIFPRIGYSAKMNELEAAVGLGTMEIADEILEQRRENYYYYSMEFSRFKDFITIEEGERERIGPHAFPIIVKEDAKFTRDDFAYYLQKNGIDNRTLFCSIPTQSSGYKWMGYEMGDFPVAEFVGRNGLHIGVHQDIGKEEREYVIKIVEKFFKEEV